MGFFKQSTLVVPCKATISPAAPVALRHYSAKPQLSKKDVEDRVIKVCQNFDKIADKKDKIKLEATFNNDLGLDSLDHVELVMAFEDEFGYEVSDAEAEKFDKPSAIVKFVLAKQAEAPKAA